MSSVTPAGDRRSRSTGAQRIAPHRPATSSSEGEVPSRSWLTELLNPTNLRQRPSCASRSRSAISARTPSPSMDVRSEQSRATSSRVREMNAQSSSRSAGTAPRSMSPDKANRSNATARLQDPKERRPYPRSRDWAEPKRTSLPNAELVPFTVRQPRKGCRRRASNRYRMPRYGSVRRRRGGRGPRPSR